MLPRSLLEVMALLALLAAKKWYIGIVQSRNLFAKNNTIMA
jgi:hypothetical protein